MAVFEEPLKAYQSRLKSAHAQFTKEALETLIQRSGVDEQANQRTIRDLHAAQASLQSAATRLQFWQGMYTLINVCLVISAIGAVVALALLASAPMPMFLVSTIVLVVLFVCLRYHLTLPKIEQWTATVKQWQQTVATLEAQAWEQMAPLNQSFTWDCVTERLRQTLPEITFDRQHTQARWQDFVQHLDWRPMLTQKISVCDLQSGDIQGNPFVIAKGRTYQMVDETYTSTKTVFVRKYYRDSNGRRRSSMVPEVLTASIVKPRPHYYDAAFVLFGSEAAPHLTFSREPSKHSGKENTFFNRLSKRRTTKKLEAFSRNLNDEYGFTMMANREFETLFHATDRSDEREFRLLFTPYAQQQMVTLLNDTTIGYGDNFRMFKDKRSTILFCNHLNKENLSLDPSQFAHYDLAKIRQTFCDFNANYFKACYFALAPLLTIPLYCHLRKPQQDVSLSEQTETSPWENELLANAYGDTIFKPSKCATPCLLKTKTHAHGDLTVFDVIAHGYQEVPRVTPVEAWDSNGICHHIPVKWFEYLPIRKTTQLVALPDRLISNGEPLTHAAAEAMLTGNGVKVTHLRHIRATYTAIVKTPLV